MVAEAHCPLVLPFPKAAKKCGVMYIPQWVHGIAPANNFAVVVVVEMTVMH